MEPGDFSSHSSPISTVIVGFTVSLLIFICCCFCPCCFLYQICCKPRPTTNTTVVTTTPQGYPMCETPYHGVQYAPYQPASDQSGYGSQPVPQDYGPQPIPTVPYHGQPFILEPPPTYQEASDLGPAYPPNLMPYSQAVLTSGQPSYPLQPPVEPLQPNSLLAQPDFLAQSPYNPDYFTGPPRTG